MKKDGKYRFSLQFGSSSTDEIRAGDFLERLGNKKSAVIVAALTEYLASHPELQEPYSKIEVKIATNYNQDQIEQIIRNIVKESLASYQISGSPNGSAPADASEVMEADVATMLGNLDLFK